MVLRVACPECDTIIRALPEQLGMHTACPRCAADVLVVDPDSSDPQPIRERPVIAKPRARGDGPPPLSLGIMVVSGLGAGAVGALAWGLLMRHAGYEHGMVSWATGGAVGLAMTATGAGGRKLGNLAALITVLAVLGGKLLGETWTAVDELEIWIGSDSHFTEEFYAELRGDAAALQSIRPDPDDATLADYMVVRGFSPAELAEGVDPEALDRFRSDWLPRLNALHDAPPGFVVWRNDEHDRMRAELFDGDSGLVSRVVDALSPMDIMFFGLAVYTAAAMVRRRGNHTDVTKRWLRRR
jgi:hypothetical protein